MTVQSFEHERLDVYRLSIDCVARSFESAQPLEGLHRHARGSALECAAIQDVLVTTKGIKVQDDAATIVNSRRARTAMNQSRRKLIVLTGAGMSAESGIPTYRGPGGLWNGHRFEDLASPEAWRRHPDVVLEFYNQRRKQILLAQPNRGHQILAQLEEQFDVAIVTQNVDNLHERAGSSQVLHLHGLITQARSSLDDTYVVDIDGWELKLGDRCPRGSQLRPNVVWFGEPVTLDRARAGMGNKWITSSETPATRRYPPSTALVGCG
jgi:hypothetical protein